MSRLFFALSLACLAAGVAAHPELQRWKTANGVPVLFAEAPEIPMFVVRVVFAAGSVEDAGRPGIAMLTAALMGEGTATLATDDFHARLEATGALLGSGLEKDYAWLSLQSLADAKYAEPALALAAEAVRAPRFAEADFELAQRQMLTGLEQRKSDPGALAERAVLELLYADHPYGQPEDGTPDSVRALTPAEVRAFHQRHYVAAKALVVMVGAVSPERAARIAEQLVGNLPSGQAAAPVPPVPAIESPALRHVPFASAQTHLILAQPGIARHDPDYFPLVVGNHVFGATPVSLLFQEIREKRGLSYAISSHFAPMAAAGPFEIILQTDQKNTREARRVLRETLNRFLIEGPTEQQLAAARENLIGGFPLRVDTNGKLLEYLTLVGFYQLPLDWLDSYPEAVARITREQIRAAFQRRIHPDTLVEVTVGPVAPGP